MSDVARRAKVSTTTVSHAINNTRPVADDTRERILRAARELNYHRNASARLLVRGYSNSFGLIISDIENPFFPEVIKSFQAAALDSGFDILLCTTGYDATQSEKTVVRMIENRVLGVAVMTSQFDVELMDELSKNEIPMVRLDARRVQRGRSSIRIDYARGARQAIGHLRDLGHRRLAMITGPKGRVSADTYTSTIVDAIKACGLRPPLLFEGNGQVDGGITGARELLVATQRPSAILCGNDLCAVGVLQAMEDFGTEVPRDISVIGSDDIAFARYANPALTTVRIARDVLGHRAFEVLLKMHKSKSQRGTESVLDTELVIRRSTARARRKDVNA